VVEIDMNGSLLRAFLLLAVVSIGSARASAGDTVVRIGYPLAINAEIPIAMQKAAIDRKHGFAGEFTTFQNGAPMFEALASNSMDVIVTSIMPTLIYLSKLPDDFRIIATPGESSSALLVGPQSTLHSVNDLKGKRVGVSFGSSQYLDLLRSLEQNGLDKNDVTLINMQPADLPLALEENLADAIVAFQPQIVKLKKDMGARSIQAWPFYYIVGVRRKFLETNPDAEPRLLAALRETETFISDNKDRSTQWLADALKINRDTVLAVGADDVAAVGRLADDQKQGITDAFKATFAEWAEATYRLGIIKRRIDPQRSFN
jgi:ABC-type nitrate/sulfonate/bicarbonate transport system substrate-binding protein